MQYLPRSNDGINYLKYTIHKSLNKIFGKSKKVNSVFAESKQVNIAVQLLQSIKKVRTKMG